MAADIASNHGNRRPWQRWFGALQKLRTAHPQISQMTQMELR